MFPHTCNPFDTRPTAKQDTAGFLAALGDSEAAAAYRKAMGEEEGSTTTDTPAPELTPEEIARLQAITDRERGSELVELRKREYLEWAEEFNLGDDTETWIADTFKFNPNGTVEVDGNLDLANKSLTRFPSALTRVNGNLTLWDNQFTSLDGLPQEIQGDLSLSDNQLTSLEGLPKEIHGDLDLSHNRLTSLEGLPTEIHGNLFLGNNHLTSLTGLPQEIHGNLYLTSNEFTSLAGLPQKIYGDLVLSYNDRLTSLNELQGKRIDGDLYLLAIDAQSIPEGIEFGGAVFLDVNQTVLKRDAISKGYTVREG